MVTKRRLIDRGLWCLFTDHTPILMASSRVDRLQYTSVRLGCHLVHACAQLDQGLNKPRAFSYGRASTILDDLQGMCRNVTAVDV